MIPATNDRAESAIVITGMSFLAPEEVSASELARQARAAATRRARTMDVELPADFGARATTVPIARIAQERIEGVPGLRRPLPDKITLMAIGVAEAALRDAGLPHASVAPHRIAMIANTCAGPNATVERFLRTLLGEGPKAISPIAFARTVVNAFGGEIARRNGLTGPGTVVMGTSAIGYAVDLLEAGRADACLCLGVDETRPGQVWAYHQAGVDPEGMVFGEAAAAVVLETESSARARGARPLCTLVDLSMGHCTEATVLLTRTTAESLGASMRTALARARRPAGDVASVVCAGNGDPELARAEDRAIREELPEGTARLWPKHCVGETFGASEVLGVITAAEQMKEGSPRELCVVNAVQPGGAVSSILVGAVS